MLWSFIAVCLSAWLSVDASYRGPTWQRWVFKPLTLLLLLLLAWQAPMFDAISYLVRRKVSTAHPAPRTFPWQPRSR